MIAVIDFGSQYTHLIARRVRELGVYCEIKLPSDDISGYSGVILSGSPFSVGDKGAPQVNSSVFNVPVLGLCYGLYQIVNHFGGKITSGKVKEYGAAKVDVLNKTGVFLGLDSSETVWMSHGDKVSSLPSGFVRIGSSKDCEFAGVADFDRKIFGLQFHPEVVHTKNGSKILSNFLDICSAKRDWNMQKFISSEISRIKETVGSRKVFLLVSGGVDSTVCFSLLNKALGKDKVYGLHIDNGFMRSGESKKVYDSLKKFGNLKLVDASEEFLDLVAGVFDPEEIRKRIGAKFVEVAEREIASFGLDSGWILAQGTIYPDRIESAGTKHSDKIKTHHNRVEEIENLISRGLVIEPIADLYKDEVRKLGLELGIHSSLIDRHPFPGPGLAVRCLCVTDTSELSEDSLEQVKSIVGDYGCFGLPIKSVGVQGDSRTYKHPVVIAGKCDWDELGKLSTSITNQVSDVNRVLFFLGCRGDNVELKRDSDLNIDRLNLLRKADDVVNKFISSKGIVSSIWQFPVVLIPVSFNGGESIVLRPVESSEAMTANFYKMDADLLSELTDKLLDISGVDAVFYDVTNKPPGTIEFL